MGAFSGLSIPYDRSCPGPAPEPGPARYPGNWAHENSNTPFLYPWGRKERNPAFNGPHLEQPMKQHEKDESKNLLKICEQMNELHAKMGGRDTRPERVALMECMEILHKVIKAPVQAPSGTQFILKD